MERQRYYNHTCQCEWCERIFQASRFDAKYCSPACRQNAHREPARRERARGHAVGAMLSYIRMAKTDRGHQAAVDYLIGVLQSNSLVEK
jgi:hypothetical protein